MLGERCFFSAGPGGVDAGAVFADRGRRPCRHRAGLGGFGPAAAGLLVLGVAARGVGRASVAVEDEGFLGRALQQGPVVAHDHEGARPRLEEVLQGPERVEVEIVGGLVEQQHVGERRHCQQQLQATPFAARQGADRGPLQVGVEAEALHEPHLLPARLGGLAGHRLPHPLVGVEVTAGLVVVGDHDRAGRLHAPLGRGQPPGQQIEQRGLPRPVGPHDGQPPAGFEVDVELPEQPCSSPKRWPPPCRVITLSPNRGVGVGFAPAPPPPVQPVGPPGPRSIGPDPLGGRSGPSFDDGFGGGDPCLRLAGTGGSAATEPRQLGPRQVASHRFGAGFLLDPDGPGVEIGGVATVVGEGPAPIQLQHPGRHPVEDVAVVGHQHQTRPGSRRGAPRARRSRRCPDGSWARRGSAGRPPTPAPGPAPPACPARPTAWRRRHRPARPSRAAPGSRPSPTPIPPLPGPNPRAAPAAGRGTPTRTPRPRRTTPDSGSAAPASTRSSVDFPVPFTPTTPSRSPVDTVSDRDSNSGRSGRRTVTRSRSTRMGTSST